MTAPSSQEPPNNPAHDEAYAHGYESALTQKFHVSRTVNKQASWFLPYLQPGMSLLDCGCATGSITVGLAAVVAPGQVTGIDISAIEIQRARARAAEAGMTNVGFEVGNMYQLDFPDNHFDALLCHNVLEHVNAPTSALQEMYRVLKSGGIIGIRDVDLGGSLYNPPDELFKRFAALYEADWAGVGSHPRLGRELRGLLTEAGFVDVVASASYEVFSDLESQRFMSQILASRVREEDFVKRVLGGGLTTAEELNAMHAAWLTWPERSDAFAATAHVEVVGRKA